MPDVLALTTSSRPKLVIVADDRRRVRRVAELQCRAIADVRAAGIGVVAEQDDGAATRTVNTVSLPGADAVGDVAGNGQYDAVGVDRTAGGGVVDLEIVGEGQIAAEPSAWNAALSSVTVPVPTELLLVTCTVVPTTSVPPV